MRSRRARSRRSRSSRAPRVSRGARAPGARRRCSRGRRLGRWWSSGSLPPELPAHAPEIEDQHVRADEEDNETLDHLGQVSGEARVDRPRLEAVRRPVEQPAEEEGGEADPDRGVASEQRYGDPEEADRRDLHVARAVLVLVAEHVEPAREAGERAGDRHRANVVDPYLDAPVRGGRRVVADRAHLVAERRAVEDQPEDYERRDGDEEADVEALEVGVAPEDRQLRALGDLARDRDVERLVLGALERAALLEDVVPDPVGDPVEHDRRDHLVGADGRLQEARDPSPDRAGRGRDRDRDQYVRRPRHVHERDADPVGAEDPDEVLAVSADVEQPAAERERDREARQDQRGRLQQRLAEVVGGGARDIGVPRRNEPVEAGALDDVPVGDERVVAGGEHEQPADQKRHQRRRRRDGDPAGALPEREAGGDGLGRRVRDVLGLLALLWRERLAHAAEGSLRLPPSISSPISSSVVSGVCSPTMRPSYMTRIRSESERISSSSSERSRIARPSSRSSTSRRCRYSIAPTSRPRVGCAATSTFGSRATSRAATTFCWLPPESAPPGVFGPPPRTSNSLISSRARCTRRPGNSQPKRESGAEL